jgi:hypothetical protein
MNMLRIGTITICALATLAGSFALKRNIADEVLDKRAPATPAAAATPARTMTVLAADDWQSPTPAGASPESEFLSEADTTGLLRESLTIDELLDEVNADSGDGFTPVDRERYAALLRSDPELRKALDE